ncbi:MAG: exodeoxyribonuclease VII small subunit [Xanthomonadales bacterium]|jgi:exodeoxyribonuclease VII small subunit|nr:exodeoxyribonuclease VII small subunit [Gammaproteobacteria bacterium]MBT8072647.1 exodeoxyribonuclease VII small subunit [Gammaproteobacteria bacterium]MBT8075677.1 exodeoxyribonuclease VII small subunit [Gammaproteobacteria bacterium]NNK03488.1 exodeoxyribonuclease VII small subunit [Xanthomonadales bacterium]NNK98609.1 exodeoxyribonuclease VII small subunit [Xanthomonadales bacterium]
MSKKTEAGPDFEKTLAELEKLVSNLEEGDLSLDESLSGFKRGIELTQQCQAVLDNAQQTVEQLTDNDDEESLKPFDPDA